MKYVGIDPSTKTGIVEISENGQVITYEIKPISTKDPSRFIEIADEVCYFLPNEREETVICIEGFAYGARGKGVSTQYGIGWTIRMELIKKGYRYIDIPPTVVKKFATGKGNAKKDAMVLPIYKHWGFEHISDNVRDAYVLAQIARALDGQGVLTKYQEEALKKVK